MPSTTFCARSSHVNTTVNGAESVLLATEEGAEYRCKLTHLNRFRVLLPLLLSSGLCLALCGCSTLALSRLSPSEPSALSCNTGSITPSSTDTCTVTLSAAAPGGGLNVSLSSSNPAVSVPDSVTVPANSASAQFAVSVAAVATNQPVTLTATAVGTSKSFTLQLNAATSALSINVSTLAFGNVVLNNPETQSIKITSTGTAPLTIQAATLVGAGFTMPDETFPATLNPGQSVSLIVQFDPSTVAPATGQLTITSNSSAGQTALISLSGTGVALGSFTYAGSPLASTITPPAPTAPISNKFFGMTILHLGSTPFPDFPVSTIRLWDVAAWSEIEPASGQFNWTHMDRTISDSETTGTSDFIFTFGSVPSWASTNPSDPCAGGDGTGTCGSPDMNAFESFTTTLVQRYCGTVKYYETWNEPNNTKYFDGTNAQLLTVAQHLYQIAKDPANCGCTNGVCSPGGGANPNQVLTPSISRVNQSTLAWLDSYLATAGTNYPYADVASFHGYGPTSPEQIIPQVQALNQTLSKHGLANLELWNTEASWGTVTSTLDQDQAAWLMRYHVALAAVGVSRFVWYAYDDCDWGTLYSSPFCTNPLTPAGQLTVPAPAYGVIEGWLSGASLTGCNEYQNGLWACELQRAGDYDAWMVWSSTGTDISVPVPADSGLTVYRDWQNNLNSLPTGLTVGQMPVLLETQDM